MEETYRTIFENTGTAAVIIEEDGIISLVNTEAERLSGYSKEELEGKKSWTEFVEEHDLERLKEYHFSRRINPDAAPRNYEFKFIDKNGNVRDIFMTVSMIPGTKKSVASLLDVTERNRAKEELQKSERRYRLLAQNVRDVIWAMDMNLRYTYISPSVTYLLGRTPEDSLENTLDMVTPTSREIALKVLQEELAVEETKEKDLFRSRTLELEFVRKDGSTVWTEVHATLMRDPDGRPVEIVGVTRDITERKQKEEQLKYASLHDPLTGLYNRICFEHEMRRLESDHHHPVGIIVCDVDGLKLVNDSLGHDTGDALLMAAADAIEKSVRVSDVVARIGGDEFAVLLSNSDETAIKSVIFRIRDTAARHNEKNPQLPLSISFGFATSSEASKSMVDLFKEADNNMYREKLHNGQSARSNMVQILLKTLEIRDFITEGHANRLQDLVVGLASTVGLPESRIADLRLLAQFHDIGKVGVPDRILFKNGPLTPEEFTELQRHCEIGYHIAQSAHDLITIADWILKHHEWWNGRGYPLGIKGEEIPQECRILAIADAYDAMTSDRPYRKAMSDEEAVAEIRRCAGTQFDPQLVQSFFQVPDKENIPGALRLRR